MNQSEESQNYSKLSLHKLRLSQRTSSHPTGDFCESNIINGQVSNVDNLKSPKKFIVRMKVQLGLSHGPEKCE